MTSIHIERALAEAPIAYLLGVDTAVDIGALESRKRESAADADKCPEDLLKMENRIGMITSQNAQFVPVHAQLPPPPVMQNLVTLWPQYPDQHPLAMHSLHVNPLLPPVHQNQSYPEPIPGMCSLVVSPSPPPDVQQVATFAEKQSPLSLCRQPIHSEQSLPELMGPRYNIQYNTQDTSGPRLRGGRDQEDPDYSYDTFSDPKDRQRFIFRDYSIISVLLICTTLITLPFKISYKVQEWAEDNPKFMKLALVTCFVTATMLICSECIHQAFPCNIICLMVLTGSLGIMTLKYETYIIITVGMTAGISVSVILFAIFAPCDVAKCGPLLRILLLILFIFWIVGTIITIYTRNKLIYLLYSLGAILLFSAFVAYDHGRPLL